MRVVLSYTFIITVAFSPGWPQTPNKHRRLILESWHAKAQNDGLIEETWKLPAQCYRLIRKAVNGWCKLQKTRTVWIINNTSREHWTKGTHQSTHHRHTPSVTQSSPRQTCSTYIPAPPTTGPRDQIASPRRTTPDVQDMSNKFPSFNAHPYFTRSRRK